MNNEDRLREHLRTALENVLAAFALSGGGSDLEDNIPTDAIDAALGVDPHVGIARQALDVAVRGLGASGAGDGRRQAVLTLEAAANALVVQSVDAAYQLGVRVGRGLMG